MFHVCMVCICAHYYDSTRQAGMSTFYFYCAAQVNKYILALPTYARRGFTRVIGSDLYFVSNFMHENVRQVKVKMVEPTFILRGWSVD